MQLIVSLAWPLLALILGTLFLFLFRKPIADFIHNLREIKAPGFGATASAPQIPPPTIENSAADELLRRVVDTPLVRERESAILAETSSLFPAEAVKVLARHLAAAQIAAFCENINATIWGSQINILYYLNAQQSPVAIDTLRPFYDNAAATWPQVYAPYPFESYLGFLQNTGLIAVNEHAQYSITLVGREFLNFLTNTGRTAPRLF